MKKRSIRTCLHNCRAGFGLVEVVICSLLVGVVLVGAMKLLGAVVSGRTTTVDKARAQQLAERLMTEILNTDYRDDNLPLFGPELGEVTGSRWLFDDVDDYHGWDCSPPQNRLGAALANSTGWRQSVSVSFVTLANPSVTTILDEGLKRITVTIYQQGAVVARSVALRSDDYTL